MYWKRKWMLSGYKCPKCGGYMIYNHTGHECSERFCNYNSKLTVNIDVRQQINLWQESSRKNRKH